MRFSFSFRNYSFGNKKSAAHFSLPVKFLIGEIKCNAPIWGSKEVVMRKIVFWALLLTLLLAPPGALAASVDAQKTALPFNCADMQMPEICWVESAYKTADVTWQSVAGATGYWLGFGFSDGGFAPLVRVKAQTRGIHLQGDLLRLWARVVHQQAGAREYHLAVKAIHEDGQTYCESDWSAGWPTPASMALASVTNLRAAKSGENVHLTWDPVVGADFYLVMRTKQADLPAGWVTMAAVPAFLPEEWDDAVVYDGESYDYDVTAQSVPAGASAAVFPVMSGMAAKMALKERVPWSY